LKPVRYTLRDEKAPRRARFGFIAQDMEKVFPEVVTTDAFGIKGIAYGELSAITVQNIQTLNREIIDLKSIIRALEKRVENLERR